VARLWAQLLGELGLRASGSDDLSRAAKAKAEAAADAVKETEADRLVAKLREDSETFDLKNAQIKRELKKDYLENMRQALRVVEGLGNEVRNLPNGERAEQRHMKLIEEHSRDKSRSFMQDIEATESELRDLDQDIRTMKDKLDRASEATAAAKAAAASAVSAAAAANSQMVERFVTLDGAKLASEGVPFLDGKVMPLLAESLERKGGIVFIDEAHNLDFAKRPKGLDVIRRIVLLSMAHKGELTFILAGYEDKIEANVMDADPGLASRFPHKVKFKDYNAPELAEIFKDQVSKIAPALAKTGTGGPSSEPPRHSVSDEVSLALGRRLVRGAGTTGFGNGRLVETRLMGILDRWRSRVIDNPAEPPAPSHENMVLTMDDVMGPEPDASSGPVGAILRRLHEMTGIAKVKAAFADLVERMREIYWADRGSVRGGTTNAGLLNRVFLGNPGTGKTTTAKLYGELLAACGFLTHGDLVELKPVDLLGSAVGESEAKTKLMLDRCAGKVMFIDEVRCFLPLRAVFWWPCHLLESSSQAAPTKPTQRCAPLVNIT